MRKELFSLDQPWCVPEPPGRTRRRCFPETPPRLPQAGQDEPWCFPDDPPRPRKRGRPRSRPKLVRAVFPLQSVVLKRPMVRPPAGIMGKLFALMSE